MPKLSDKVTTLYTAFADRDLPAIARLVHPEIHISQTPLLPWGGDYNGLDGLGDFFQSLLQHVDSRVELTEFIEAGDSVVALGWTRGKVRSHDTPFEIRVAHIWTFRDGLAIHFQPYIQTEEMLRALGEI